MTSIRVIRYIPVSVLLLLVSACGGPQILSKYQSKHGVNRGPREGGPHAGVDFGGRHGAPIFAAADGQVLSVTEAPTGCGIGVLLGHPNFGRYTVYCHLKKVLVSEGQKIQRGEVIGKMGFTGDAYGVNHVHLELCTHEYNCYRGHRDGDLWGTEDPLAIMVGCFEPNKSYPTERLVLTYPVECSKLGKVVKTE